jgi:hypothetical protein
VIRASRSNGERSSQEVSEIKETSREREQHCDHCREHDHRHDPELGKFPVAVQAFDPPEMIGGVPGFAQPVAASELAF